MEENKTKKGGKIIAFVILYVLIAVGMCYGFTIPATALLAASVVVFGWWAIVPTVCTFALAFVLFASSQTVLLDLCAIALYVCLGLVAGCMLRFKAPNRTVLLVMCTLIVIGSFGLYIGEAHIKDTSVADVMTAYIGEDEVDELSAYGVDMESVLYAMDAFSSILLAGMIFVFARIVAIVLSVIPAFAKKQGKGLIRPMAPFMLWMLSDNFSIGLALATMAVIAVNIMGMGSAAVISAVLATIFLTPIFVQGVSFMMFLATGMRKTGRGFGSTMLLYLGCVFLMPMSFIVLGLVDQFTHYRKRRFKIAVVHFEDENAKSEMKSAGCDDNSDKNDENCSGSDDDDKSNNGDS